MSQNTNTTTIQTSSKQYDIAIVHSGSEADRRLELFIREKLDILKLSCGPMNYDRNEADSAIFNDNLRTIKQSRKVVLIFSPTSRKVKRCRFERLFALHLHVRFKLPIVIPIVIGNIQIPDKYLVFQQVVVKTSNSWCANLLRALVAGTTEQLPKLKDDIFVNEGRKDIELFIETEEVLDDMNEFEFDEFGTAFDTICFEFLDEFMKNTLGKTHANNELDEILQLQTQLCGRLENSSLQTRMEFLRMNSTSGIFSYIGQMGLNNVHKLLMQGCGINVTHDLISLKWKTFEQNLICNSITLSDIVNFGKFVGIRRISIKFDKESYDNIEKHYGKDWQKLLVMFAENIMKKRFHESDDQVITYQININGRVGPSAENFINDTGRSIFLDNCELHKEHFQELTNRLQTYENWPSHLITKPLELAKAGFIYSGHGDTVTCFSCNQSYSGVDNLGNPSTYQEALINHCYWNQDCDFLKAVPEYQDVQTSADDIRKFRQQTGVDRASVIFHTTSARLSTFDSSLPKLRCLDFAKAGFYQTSFATDCFSISCFSCAVHMYSVKLSQDPWIEHVRWSPKCQYILTRRGQQFVESILRVLAAENEGDVHTEVVIETFVLKTDRKDSEKEHVLKPCSYIENIELD